jgi:hypothetical protein
MQFSDQAYAKLASLTPHELDDLTELGIRDDVKHADAVEMLTDVRDAVVQGDRDGYFDAARKIDKMSHELADGLVPIPTHKCVQWYAYSGSAWSADLGYAMELASEFDFGNHLYSTQTGTDAVILALYSVFREAIEHVTAFLAENTYRYVAHDDAEGDACNYSERFVTVPDGTDPDDMRCPDECPNSFVESLDS